MGQLTQFIAIISGAIGATVVRVIDGDTVRVRASVWFGLTVEVDVRLAGADAPEMRGRCTREKIVGRCARRVACDAGERPGGVARRVLRPIRGPCDGPDRRAER